MPDKGEYTTFEENIRKSLIKGRVLDTLEFPKIRDELVSCARTPYGQVLCRDLCPSTDRELVSSALEDTCYAADYIRNFGTPPLSCGADITSRVSYAAAGGTLSMPDLLDIATFFECIKELREKGHNARESGITSDALNYISKMESVTGNDDLLADIRRCILGPEEMADNASSDLMSIRREKRDLARSIRVLLDRVISRNSEFLREDIITIREGRYCIPVISDFKGRIDGIIHGSSGSEQTIFVEPMSVVETNNKIKELQLREEAEIERICHVFSGKIADNASSIEEDKKMIGDLDFACAKAELGLRMEGVAARLSDRGALDLRRARHPLIPSDRVVPIDVAVGTDYDTLVVTGPNTGGKTVCLKTCGLLTLMTMAGLMIPAADGSEVAVFDRVLADIGDEQSIEQSLSTFSAHISNIVFILKNVRGRSLVLLDELGSGTDPTEGAALAIAILDELRSKGCATVATTHYKELKSYAITEEGICNASCEFDTESLSPTYRLIIGRPGASNAFIISEKLGLHSRVIKRAKENMSADELSFGTLLTKAEEDSREAERLRSENEQLNRRLADKERELDEEKRKLKESKTKILNDMRSEQKDLLAKKEKELEEMIKDLDRARREESLKDARAEADKVRRRLRSGISSIEMEEAAEDLSDRVALAGEKAKEIVVGQMYYIPSLGITAKVMSEPSRGKVKVASGALNCEVKTSDLYMPTKEQKKHAKTISQNRAKTQTVQEVRERDKLFDSRLSTSSEINLIGMTCNDAVSRLEKFLDDCSLARKSEIRIVHGKGTGALRSAVAEVLDNDPRVASYRDGAIGEGDAGVTIARLG
ncbi:MAG: endonuclease MutS2 [Clostridiales bacterium]|nr:endonuclease MutS2 [Clostridiales bacterium]